MKIHVICTSEKFALNFHLSAGNQRNGPEYRKLTDSIDCKTGPYLLMDRTLEDDKNKALAFKRGLVSVVPPKKNRKIPWKYDSELYKRKNKFEIFSSS